MTTRPDAARGKTTRKGKIRKIINKLKEAQPPIIRPDRNPPNRRSFGDDLENIRGRVDEIAETIIGTFPLVGTKPLRRAFGKKNLKDEMADGGEVMDLTTEVEVE
jgi:hypothetical protein